MRNMESFGMAESKSKSAYWEMGQRIIKARENLTNMSQSDMTTALGLKEPTYGNYERGSRRMPPHVMDKFKEITGCNADWIYLGKGSMKGGAMPPDVQELIDNYISAGEEAQAAFLHMSRQLPKKN